MAGETSSRSLLAVIACVVVVAAGCAKSEDPPTTDVGPLGQKIHDALAQVSAGLSLYRPSSVPDVLDKQASESQSSKGWTPAALPIPWGFDVEVQKNGTKWSPDPSIALLTSEFRPPCVSSGALTKPISNDGLQVPVHVEVHWDVNSSGTVSPEEGTDYAKGRYSDGQFVADPEDADPIVQSFITLPPVVEIGSQVRATRTIRATVKVTADLTKVDQLNDDNEQELCGITPGTKTIASETRLELPLPAIYALRLPTILGLNEDSSFAGDTLLLLPSRLGFIASGADTFDDALWNGKLNEAAVALGHGMTELQGLTGKLDAAKSLLAVLSGIELLRKLSVSKTPRVTVLNGTAHCYTQYSGLDNRPRRVCHPADHDQVHNLNVDDPGDGAPYQEAYTLRKGGCFIVCTHDVEANDVVSSAFLLAPYNAGVELYSNENFSPDEGELDMTVPVRGFFVAMPSLHFKSFKAPQFSTSGLSPSDLATQLQPKTSTNQTIGYGAVTPCAGHIDDDGYGNSLSSLKFAIAETACDPSGGRSSTEVRSTATPVPTESPLIHGDIVVKPTASPRPTPTMTPTPRPDCDPLEISRLAAAPEDDGRVRVDWMWTGGCPPTGGLLEARYVSPRNEAQSYATYAADSHGCPAQGSPGGCVLDTPPQRCEPAGDWRVEYRLRIHDRDHREVARTTTATATWIC